MPNCSCEESITVGRFAPSPTGLLHFGSLITAVASYCYARSQRGKWLIRMEDLDTPRNVPGAADAILRQLEQLGLFWDDSVIYQSERLDFYADILQQFIDSGHVYRCTCTRREIAAHAREHGPAGPIYSGLCRFKKHNDSTRGSWRLGIERKSIVFTDLLHGYVEQSLGDVVGDYILKRTDNIFAYQFATPLDDMAQEITQVIRGADLLDSTPRQIYLMQLLDGPLPEYGHIPLALDEKGNKISKSNQALRNIDAYHPLPFSTPDLFRALSFLGQDPPPPLQYGSAVTLLDWAVSNFKPLLIPQSNLCVHS
ncbi:MAG: tRNA glutamyl-Q(34) synthetase GluQRS [Thermodesulfobacteriota bacterium]